MKYKLKNILIFLSILAILVGGVSFGFGREIFAVDEGDLVFLKNKLNELNERKNYCLRLSGNAKINCISQVMYEINYVLNQLQKHENDVSQTLSRINQDIQNLKNQISYIDAQTEKTQIEIMTLEQQINYTKLEISRTEEEISITERNMKENKERLIAAIRSYYEYDKKDSAMISILDGNLSDFYDKLVYLDNIQKEISQNLAKIKEQKINLENKKSQLESNKKNLEITIDSYNRQIIEMQALREQKADLLEITKGNEEEYQKMMERIKEAKSLAVARLSQVRAEYIKFIPQSGSCGGFPYYSQLGGWGTMNGGCSIADVGCAVTSTAMVFTYYGRYATPRDIGKYTNGNCEIVWYRAGMAYKMKTINILYSLPQAERIYGYPLIVHTNLYDGPYGHYVVIINKTEGGYLIADPWSGGCWELKNGDAKIDQVVIYRP